MSLNIVYPVGTFSFGKTGAIILLWLLLTGGCTPLNSQVAPSTPVAVKFTQAATATLETSPSAAAEPTQAIAATVNGQAILLDDLRRELAAFSPDEANAGTAADLKLAILNRMIDQQIIAQNAQRLGLEVTEAELNAAKNALSGSTSLEAWLALNGLSVEQFDLTLKQELLAERLFNDQTKNIAPTAEQVRLFFLWVDSESLAETVTQRLQEVDDFTQVSQAIQSDNPDRAGGGYADWFGIDNSQVLPAEVETVAFTLETGQTKGPIAAANRQYFIKLEEKDSRRLLPAQELQQIKQAAFEQWLAEQKNLADIKVYITVE